MRKERQSYWLVWDYGKTDGPVESVRAAVQLVVRLQGLRRSAETYSTRWWVEGWTEEKESDSAEWLGVWEIPVCDSQVHRALEELEGKRHSERLHTLSLHTLRGELGTVCYWAALGDWTDAERKARQYLLQVAPHLREDWLLHSVQREEVVR